MNDKQQQQQKDAQTKPAATPKDSAAQTKRTDQNNEARGGANGTGGVGGTGGSAL